MGIRETIQQLFSTPEQLPVGIYHFQSPPDNPLNYRLHLRIEPGRKGVLIVNASTILHLNSTAAEYAYHLVNETPENQIPDEVAKRYRVDSDTASQDFTELKEQIEILITTPDLDPISFLHFDRHTPYTDEISAPYRLDCALTYQLPNESDSQAAPTKRVERELTTAEWKTIIDKAWSAGIPHITFTGGEPTLREDLAELIAYAEANGQVTGLLTDGLKLSDSAYLNSLLLAGLDHAMIILHPDDDQTWESLASFAYWAEALDEDIFVAAHLTLTPESSAQAMQLLDKLAVASVSGVSLSANHKSLVNELQEARSYADDLDLALVWDLPVPYSNINPVSLELADEENEAHPDGAGRGWLYVEPDGDVLPAQGINKILGNLLTDSWEKIWKSASEFK